MPQWRLRWSVQRCRAWLAASFSSCRDYRKRNWENQPVKFEWWLTPSRDSHHLYQRLPWRKHFADLYRWHTGIGKSGEQGGRISAGNGEQQSAGGLGIEKDGPDFCRDALTIADQAFREVAVIVEAAGDEAGAHAVHGPGKQRNVGRIDAHGNAAACGHLPRMADKAEAGNVRGGVNGELARRGNFSGAPIQRGHGLGGGVDPFLLGLTALDGRGDHARPQALGKNERVKDLSIGVGPDFLRMDHAGDGVAKFNLRIAHAMATDHDATGFHHLGKAAGKNLLQNVEVAFIGKADDGQRGQRASAHGVNVAQRISGRDLAEGVWVVNDGREEIYGLDKRLRGGNFVHSGVVGCVKANQNVRVILPG